uniref:Uncharacterized protein n=1 Tax=Pseudo-nitzschia australis TaxID=44445 RepID=A0A7S4EG97_9STRA
MAMISRFSARTVIVIATAVGNTLQTGYSLSVIGKRVTIARRQQQNIRSVLSASSNLNFAAPEEKEENTDESLARWEEMYQQGGETRQQQIIAMKSTIGGDVQFDDDNSPKVTAPVRVVTFDLDNTLWKTSETISAANDALAAYLSTKSNDNGIELKIPNRIEKVMGDLFKADRRLYCPLVGATIPMENNEDGENNDNSDALLKQTLKSPVSLTQLRIDALCYVLETENDFTPDRAMSFAVDAFDIWTRARHDAIIDHLAPQVEETLNDIRTVITSDDGPVLLGAVTDGNSDPRKIEILAPYFDFCVNAESVGVSKPDKRVYLQAIRRAMMVKPCLFSDLLPPGAIVGEDNNFHETIDNETLENLVGPYWCHIGDDFLKDIVAAKDMKMRTIFAVGLVKEKLLAGTDMQKEKEMDMKEFVKKVSSETVITLGIGADDYLARSLRGEFVDAVAEDFSEIGKILVQWHSEADDSATSVYEAREKPQITEQPSISSNDSEDEKQKQKQNILEVIEPSSNGNIGGIPVTPLANKNRLGEMDFLLPRAFRIIREDCSVDIPAPLREREERTMKDVMGMAQKEKSSGVFAFHPDDVASLNDGKRVLMIQIGDTDLKFSRDIFSNMSVEEVLSLTTENPVRLSLYMTEASDQPSFDLF